MNLSSTIKGAKGLGSRLGALPRYLSAVLSQGLVSGFHFVLNLLLVRLLLAADFGIFALTFVIAFMASSIANALFATPLCVFAPAAKNDTERQYTESMLTTLMAFLLGGVLMTGFILLIGTASTTLDTRTLLAALAFIVAYLARQYSRSFGYARFDVIAVLYGDMMYVVIGVGLISLLLWNGITLTVFDVLSVLAVANIIAVLTELSRLPSPLTLLPLKTALAGYQSIWLQSRWALLGAVTTLLVSHAHTVLVSVLKGPAAFAPLAAGFVLFGPVRVIFLTIQNVIKPEMAQAISRGHSASAERQMLLASTISMLAVGCLGSLILLAWPLLDVWLYQDQYATEPMRDIVMLWCAITLIAAVQNGPFAALQSLRVFKPLAVVTVYGAILSLTIVAALLAVLPTYTSILGVLLAESFVAVWVVRLSRQQFARLDRLRPDQQPV